MPGEDRREDQESRDRLRAIQKGYARWTRITYRALVVIGVTLVVTTGALGLVIRQNNRQGGQIRHEAESTTRALCTLRADLQQRVDSARDFLIEHPNGIPGITAATLRTSIANQQQTINALASLNCGE